MSHKPSAEVTVSGPLYFLMVGHIDGEMIWQQRSHCIAAPVLQSKEFHCSFVPSLRMQPCIIDDIWHFDWIKSSQYKKMETPHQTNIIIYFEYTQNPC